MQERYFYHNFPRRGASTADEIGKGCKILAAIRDFGLLLTPQVIEWQQPSAGGAAPRIFPVLQRRVCFTELAPFELPAHAEKFGHFALEFDIATVRSLGAVPVFYVPQPTSEAVDGSAIGTGLLAIAMDSYAVVNRMAMLDKIFKGSTPVADKLDVNFGFTRSPDGIGKFRIDRDEAKNFLAAVGHAVTPWDHLEQGAYALLNFFHPTDNLKAGKALDYYREREWRIAYGFRLNHPDGSQIDVLHVPTEIERKRFIEIDPEFFGRTISTDTYTGPALDAARVHPGLGDKRLIDMVRRIVVPAPAIAQAKEILTGLANPPPVISVDEL